MNKIITSIILLALCIALIIGVVIPVCRQIKSTGETSYEAVKNMNTNIKAD